MRSIRPVLQSELDQCVLVVQKSFGTVAKEYGLTQANAPTHGAFTERSHLETDRMRGALLYGLFENENIVGFMELKKREDVAKLEKLCVLPEHRHTGCATSMLQFAAKQAAEMGCNAMEIGIIEDNRTLRIWYEARGFAHTSSAKYDHLPFTVGFMRLVLQKDHTP